MRLGVNIDHIATLRTARGTKYPDPVVGALLAEYAGCDSIVAHLREDRRHIKERDVALICKAVDSPFNLEMSINRVIVTYALKIKPHQATLVPERRRELTTEGGIDLRKKQALIGRTIEQLQKKGIRVSLFIDPVQHQIKRAKSMGADMVEFNTGSYSECKTSSRQTAALKKLKDAVHSARKCGFLVAAGHGLDYENVRKVACIKEITELNIGHSIICRSLFVGLVAAVEEMIAILNAAKRS